MADKKKNTPLDVPKVKRGVKEALTPGQKPEKEETPIEKVIGRELTKIVEKIDFDAKFESIKVAIESKQSETLLPILEKISSKLNPILGALYGISNINESTNPDSLLSRLGNLDPKLTTFGPLDFKLSAIYDLLVSEIKSKSSYKLEDLAIAVSAEIEKVLKNIDNRDVLESLSKTLEEMKSSVLSNYSAENINRIYKQLEVISNFVSSNKQIDYSVAISDVATKISNIASLLSSNDSSDKVDNSGSLKTLSEMSSTLKSMYELASNNIEQSTNVLREISGKLDSINSETFIVDNNNVADKLEDIKKILTDYTSNYKNLNESSKDVSTIDTNYDSIISSITDNTKTITDRIKEIIDPINKLVNTNDFNARISGIIDAINSLSSSKDVNTVDNKNVADKLEGIKKILVDYTSNSNNLNESSKDVSTINTKYDYIIDNTNDIIDQINDILNKKTGLVNIVEFNSRTAQIIDAINSLSSSKDVNTQALKYNVNIEASGLDKDTVEALIDLSNINLDSNEYLKNLNSILSSLSNFEALNDIKLNNKNIKNIVDSINALSKMNLAEDTFDPFSVDCLKYFIDTLGSINLSDLNQFDEDSLKSISIITDTLSSFSNLKLKNFNQNIQSLNADEFVKLLNTLKDIPVYDKEDKTTMTAISDLFSAISSISGFDNKKFEDLSSNLRKMIRLTEKPTAFTKLKISDRGLIHILMHNIGEIAAETEKTFDNTKNIGKMLNLICTISQYDPKSFNNLKYISYILAVITSKDEPYLYKAFKNIEEIGSVISGWDAKNGPVLLIGNQLKLINNLSSKIKLKNVSSLAIKSTIALGAMYLLSKTFNYLEEILKSSENVEKNIKTLNSALVGINSIESIDINKIEYLNESLKILISSFNYLEKLAAIPYKEIDISDKTDVLNTAAGKINSIKTINIDNIKNLNEGLKALILSAVYLKILGLIPSKEIDISKNVEVLNNVVEQINNIKAVKNKDNIESLNDSIKSILTLNIWLAIIGVTMPLAFIGAIAINKEVSILSKIAGKLNELQPVKDDVVKNLKSLAIVIVAASGLLLFGAFVGGYVLDNFFEIIGFTVVLSTFIFLTIGAFNLATKGMKEAKLNAEEFGKLLLISGGIMLLGGAIMTLYWPLVLGSLGFSVALGAFILMTIGALNLSSKNIDSSIKTAEDLVVLVGIAAGVMLIGGTLFALYPWLMATTLLFGVYLTAFVTGITFLFNWAGGLVDDATSGAQKFAILVGVATISLLIGGFLFMVYPWMMLTTLLFGIYLTAFVVGVTFLFNMVSGSLDEAVSSADKFAILVGVSALALCLGGFLFQKYPWMMLTTLLFGVYLAAFVGAVVFAFGLASKFIERAEIDALNFAKIIGISAAAMLIGGLFMLIPGMPLAVLEFTGIFILFLGATLLAYAIASKHIKEAKQTAIGFGVVVLLTSMALLVGGGLFLYFPGLDIECLKFARISALFIAIFGVAIWLLGKLKKKDLIQGELALAGIAVLIGGFGYAFTFVAEAMDMISKVNDPLGQLKIMRDVFLAIGATVAVLAAVSAIPGVAQALAIGEALLAGIEVLIWGMGKAMSSIAQSMADLDKVKDFDSEKVTSAIVDYIKLVPALAPLANPAILVSMLAVKASVLAMSKAISAIATSVKAVCDLKTEDGRQLTSQDFTLAAENIKSVVTILGRSLIEVYDENEEIFSSGSTIGDLLGADSKFSRVAKSCATMGQLITDISAGVKDFADLKMPIYDENGKIKGYRSMNDKDFETAGKSIAQVVTTIGTALIGIYDGHAEMFEWKLIGDNPFAMVSKSCLTMGKLITNISAGVKDFAELRMPIYDENGKITGYREMDTKDFINAGLNIGIVLTCLATAIKGVYDDPKNKYMFTDPSTWHTSADKTPFGMVVKAMTGVGTLVKDGATAIKEIADMKFDNLEELEGENGKVARIISVLAVSIRSVYDNNKEIFTDDSFWHKDPQKTPFGMVTQCLNKAIPLVKNTVATVDDIAKMKFTGNDLTKGGKLYAKINSIIGVIPKAVIDIIRDKTYGEYLKDSDYFEIYENMKTSYSKFSDVIEEIIGSYDSINKIEYDDKKINSMKHTIKLMILSLCNVITDKDILNLLDSEIFKNNKKSDKNKLSVIASAFEEFNEIIEEVSTAYDSINKSLSNLGVKDNDTTVITTITSNLNTMISKLSESITLNTISLDAEKVNSFSANVSSFYSSIETLTRAYKLIPDDLSNYDNVVKAMGGINSKITEIPNLDQFNAEQKALENYVITLNNLDLTKVQTLSNLMSVMNELATKLGSLDKFTNVLNNKISATLNNLASQIKTSGDIINKADELQKKRHEAIKASIKEIQDIMDKKLIVEVNHNEIQSTTGDYTEQPIGQNSTPSFLERAGNALGGLFGFNNEDSQNSNGANVSHVSNNTQPLGSVGGIDYDRLKRAIMQAIMEASPSPK